MAAPQKRVELRRYEANYEEAEGHLVIFEDEVEWTAKPNQGSKSEMQVKMPINAIKKILGHKQQSKIMFEVQTKTGLMKYIILFAAITTRDECKDFIVKVQQKQFNSSEMRLKIQLFQKDPKLRQLYDELVRSKKILTEEEFWRGREALLQKEQETKQIAAIRNSLASEIRQATVVDTTSSSTTIKLTPQLIQQIFIVYPAVKKAFTANVPHRMTEAEFWTKFMKSNYFHRSSRTSLLHDAPRSREEEELFGHFEKEIEANAAKEVLEAPVQRYVDLRKDERIHAGYGVKQDEMTTASELKSSLSVIKQFNRQSEIVVKSNIQLAGSAAAKAVSLQDKMENPANLIAEDQINDTSEQFVPLQIQDKQRYFQTHASESPAGDVIPQFKRLGDYTMSSLLREFEEEVQEFTPDLSKAVIPFELATRITNEIIRQSSDMAENSFALLRMHETNSIPQDFFAKLNSQFQVTGELLRHFWSSIENYTPPVKLAGTKLEKIIHCLQNSSDVLKALMNDYKSDHKLTTLVKPLLQRIEFAILKYDKMQESPSSSLASTSSSAAAAASNGGPQGFKPLSIRVEQPSSQPKLQFQIGSATTPPGTAPSFTGFSFSAAPAPAPAPAAAPANPLSFSFGGAPPLNGNGAGTQQLNPFNNTSANLMDLEEEESVFERNAKRPRY